MTARGGGRAWHSNANAPAYQMINNVLEWAGTIAASYGAIKTTQMPISIDATPDRNI